jgi:hypothetical protein
MEVLVRVKAGPLVKLTFAWELLMSILAPLCVQWKVALPLSPALQEQSLLASWWLELVSLHPLLHSVCGETRILGVPLASR